MSLEICEVVLKELLVVNRDGKSLYLPSHVLLLLYLLPMIDVLINHSVLVWLQRLSHVTQYQRQPLNALFQVSLQEEINPITTLGLDPE